MGLEIVTVGAGAGLYTAFERIEVRASHKEAARSFSLVIAAEFGASAAKWTFAAGSPVTILFNGELVLTGYVDRYQPRLSDHSTAEIHVSGRSKAQDWIDSSALHKTGTFKKKTILQIAKELDVAGVGCSASAALDVIEKYQLTPGETVFNCLEKIARKQGLTLSGQPDGSVKFATIGAGVHAPIVEGQNLLRGEADHNWSDRHSKVIVRAQRAIGHGKDALEIEETADDSAVNRQRPIIIAQDDDADKSAAKKRAKNRRNREAGNSLKANVTVQGFRDLAGKIWTPGDTVTLISPFLGVEQAMLVESVNFSQARGQGSLSQLSLVDPRAYGGKSSKGGKSAAAWNTSASE